MMTFLQAASKSTMLTMLQRDLRKVKQELASLPRHAVGKAGGTWASLNEQLLNLQRSIRDLETELSQ